MPQSYCGGCFSLHFVDKPVDMFVDYPVDIIVNNHVKPYQFYVYLRLSENTFWFSYPFILIVLKRFLLEKEMRLWHSAARGSQIIGLLDV